MTGKAGFEPFVWAFADLAAIALYQGNHRQSIEFARTGAGHPDDRQDRFCRAILPYYLAVGGARDEAAKIADKIVAEALSTGIPSSFAVALMGKGMAFAETDPELGAKSFEQAIAVARESGNRFWEIGIAPALALMQARRGDPVSASAGLLKMLESWGRSTDLNFVSNGLGSLILLFDRLGHVEAAAMVNGALANMVESIAFIPELPNTVARIQLALGERLFDEAKSRGAAMTHREIVNYTADQIRQALAELAARSAEETAKGA